MNKKEYSKKQLKKKLGMLTTNNIVFTWFDIGIYSE